MTRLWRTSAGRLVLAAFALLLVCRVAPAQPVVIEDFQELSDWQVVASEGVKCQISPAVRELAGVMRLEYHFLSGAGYCVVRKRVSMDLDPNYRFVFDIKGNAPSNNLEFKLVSPSGEDVWWVNRRGFTPPREWTRLTQKRRHFEFAWGPSGGAPMKQVGWIEIAISAGEGGSGVIFLDQLTYEPLPEHEPTPDHPHVRTGKGAGEENAELDMGEAFPWEGAPGEDAWVELRFDEPVEINAVELVWQEGHTPRRFTLDVERVGGVRSRSLSALPGLQAFFMPETEINAVCVRIDDAGHAPAVLRSIHLSPIDESADVNAFFARLATRAPPGSYPAYFSGRQTPWTVVGVPGSDREALLSADGAVELDKGGFTIEPFLVAGDQVLTWADAEISPSLEEGYLPIPSVRWDCGDLRLETTALATGEAGSSRVLLRYRVTNRGRASRSVRLVLAARPFQALPPWQRLNIVGGFSPIRELLVERDRMVINGRRRVDALTKADWVVPATSVSIADHIRSTETNSSMTVTDQEQGFAAGAMVYNLALGGGESGDVILAAGLEGVEKATSSGLEGSASDIFSLALERERQRWRDLLDTPRIVLPEPAAEMARASRTTVADILINQDGPAIQPGSRTYERSWIRDGSITSLALIASGHADAAREFVDWYAKRQFESGKVPCVVDQRGPDPVDEHDSTGELIFAIWQVYLATGDRAFLGRHFPRVERAVAYLRSLREKRLTREYVDADDPLQRAKAGLVPESISHEGYSAKPMHSYWDDFFVLRGLEDAASIAGELGRAEREREYGALADDFRRTLYASIQLAAETHAIDYIPGCVELGDFDATSTAIAVSPGRNLGSPIEPMLRDTFDRYWDFFVARRDGRADWDAFTPYEFRIAGTFVRLGESARARALLDWFMLARTPSAWNQWPEVAYHDPTKPAFVGDIPHTWVGSAFVLSFYSLFAYDRGDEIVVAPGLDRSWVFSSTGVDVADFRTRWGTLAYTYRGEGRRAVLEITSSPRSPGGLVAHPPGAGEYVIKVDGVRATADADGGVHVSAAPHSIEFVAKE
ncbi:MAG: hypothetical protein R3B57_09670 [Phycisphaerales bacterium]